MFTLCSDINNANFDETLLLSILSKFKLTSLVVRYEDEDEDFFMKLLKIPSIQETLEHFNIYDLYILKCASVFELLVEFKRIKTIWIVWQYSKADNNDELEEWQMEIKQFDKKMKKKHSEIKIKFDYEYKEEY